MAKQIRLQYQLMSSFMEILAFCQSIFNLYVLLSSFQAGVYHYSDVGDTSSLLKSLNKCHVASCLVLILIWNTELTQKQWH